MKILRVIHSLDPQNGGTVEASLQSSRALSQKGHEVEFASFDAPHEDFLKAKGFPMTGLGSFFPRYGLNFGYTKWLRKKAQNFDCVLVEGIWQFLSFGTHLALRKTDTPYFIFTHGMLDPWFHKGHPLKYTKKIIYWMIAERASMKGARSVLFTTKAEMELAQHSMPFSSFNSTITPIGIERPTPCDNQDADPFYEKFPRTRGKRNLLFMSRIHPKKGCDHLIMALAKIKPKLHNIHLIMAGPDSASWIAQLKSLAKDQGVEEDITWTGMIKGEEKNMAFLASEAFILPSHQENFGIAIAEALARGLPVLTTRQVNIWKEIEDSEAGWISEDTLQGCVQNIQHWLDKSDPTAMRQKALKCFTDHFDITQQTETLIKAISS